MWRQEHVGNRPLFPHKEGKKAHAPGLKILTLMSILLLSIILYHNAESLFFSNSLVLRFLAFVKIMTKSKIKKVLCLVITQMEQSCLSTRLPELVLQGLCAQVKPVVRYTTEEELGMPWTIVVVGVPLMALKMCSESGRALFMPSSTGLIWNKEEWNNQ